MATGLKAISRPPVPPPAAEDWRELPGELSARTVVSRAQAMTGTSLIAALIVAVALAPGVALLCFCAGVCALGAAGALHLLLLVGTGARSRAHVVCAPFLPDDQLPSYTILAPLHREAAAVGGLVRALAALDYPPGRLEIKLIVEHDDHETLDALEPIELAPQFDLVLLPDGWPHTKPRACNFALHEVRTEMVVIFDAEDRPEPDQLRKAAAVFHDAPPDMACLQAHLDFWNPNTNLMTRFATCEYNTMWEMFRPGLDRLGAPIPLGGTSNHFPTATLRQLGGWDEFNVTEDIDLGLRLARGGYRTRMLESTTYEEANTAVGNWIRQRSRWTKGWLQTWLVHHRHPLQLTREIGARGVLHFNLTVLPATLGMLFSPVMWLLGVLWVVARFVPVGVPGWLLWLAAGTMLFGALAGIPTALVGLRRRGHRNLAPILLLMPAYDLLKSIAAVKAIWQLLTRPHYWEKTTHGLVAEPAEPVFAPLVAEGGG